MEELYKMEAREDWQIHPAESLSIVHSTLDDNRKPLALLGAGALHPLNFKVQS